MARPTSLCIKEILSYNGKMDTPIYREDLEILSEELGEMYEVKVWTFNKHLRVAVLRDGVAFETKTKF